MRRKNTRSSTKPSPDKVKEEKSTKKSRRHSKRHKQTSSESESDDVVSVASTDNGNTQSEKELWTVTQTDQSNNDIGKIKICLARPNPATPERPGPEPRPERTSKRLRNKPIVSVEDSAVDDKPTRRSRRRGGSSPVKKDEQQQQDIEQFDEKKGKGKSKGKHKSKIVEQTAKVVEQTEMQSEISENVQVTAQSPQNVDNTDADIVDRDLNQFEDENSVNKSVESSIVEEQSLDNQDTNDNVIDACSNNDISNNNVATDNQLPPADVQTCNVDHANAGIGTLDESSNKTVDEETVIEPESAEVSAKFEDTDISMKEVTHFEINVSTNDSKLEETDAKDEAESQIDDKKNILVQSKQDVKVEIGQVKTEGEVSSTKAEVEPIKVDEPTKVEVKATKIEGEPLKFEKQEYGDAIPVKKEERLEDPLNIQEEDKSSIKTETPKIEAEEIKQKIEVPVVEPAKMEESRSHKEKHHLKAESSPESSPEITKESESIAEQKPASPKPSEVEVEVHSGESTISETRSEEKEVFSAPKPEEKQEEQEEKEPEPAIEVPEQLIEEQQPESAPVQEPRSPRENPTKPVLLLKREEKGEEDKKSEEAKPLDGDKPQKTAARHTRNDRKSWGEGNAIPDFIQISSTQLLEMYPTLTLVDESHVKLDITHREKERERPHETDKPIERLERRVSLEEKPERERRVEETTSTPATHADISNPSNSIAMNRKISIVEDEASSLRPPPSPAKHDKSDVLFITNLVRPFTVKQLRGLLERTGKITEEGFWTDKIKSKCYVQYETDEEAEATRNALHGVLWPIGNGKKLIIDYSTQLELENAKNPPIVVVPLPVVEPEKENQEPPTKKPALENDPIVKDDFYATVHWNEASKDKEMRSRRSGSRDTKRRYSQSRRTRSVSEEIKKKPKREEPIPQRAMDDLFRKTEATPSIYWQPLTPDEISLKQQQRLERMEAHKRKMETQTQSRPRRNNDRPRGGPYRRRY